MPRSFDQFPVYDQVVLNEQQQAIFAAVLGAIDHPSSTQRAFSVDGPGESGETTLYEAICQDLWRRNIKFLCVITTGIAVTLLPFGKNAHSAFKSPLILNKSSVLIVSCGTADAQVLRDIQLILWDEATIANGFMVRCASNCVVDMNDSREIFGGKVVLFGRYFRQCLPVIRRAYRSEIIENAIKQGPFWPQLRVFSLIHNMRVQDDETFSQYLLQIGNRSSASTVILPSQITTNRS